MFYGSSSGASMSLPSKNRMKRQSKTFTQVHERICCVRANSFTTIFSLKGQKWTRNKEARKLEDPII